MREQLHKPGAFPSSRCATCVELLLEGSRLASRAQKLDVAVEQARRIGKGCATAALAILTAYDRDLAAWQEAIPKHLLNHDELFPHTEVRALEHASQPS